MTTEQAPLETQWTGDAETWTFVDDPMTEYPMLVMDDGRKVMLCREGLVIFGQDNLLTWDELLRVLSAQVKERRLYA